MRRAVPILILAAACGDPAGPVGEVPALLAVNGTGLPRIAPNDTLALEGRGFGDAQGNGTVALDGTPLEILRWSPTGITAVAQAGGAGDLVVTLADGFTLAPVMALAAPVDTLGTDARPWSAGADAPVALAQASAAGVPIATATGYTSYVVAFGGRRADGSLTDSTRIGRTAGGAAVTAWTSAPDSIVPLARRLHAMVGASSLTSRVRTGGVAWMIGGIDSAGRTLAEVLGISISETGAYGFWTQLTPIPGERGGLAAAVGHGVVYVAGGFDAARVARREVWAATINPEGTINGWFRGPDLPTGLAFAAAVVSDGRLYVAGGVTGNAHPDTTILSSLSNAVYSIPLSRRTGFIVDSAWTVEPEPLLHARARHALFAAGGQLIAVGGVRADSAAAETEAARLVAGVLGPFQARTAPARPGGPLRDFAAPVLFDGSGRTVVTVIGGTDSTGATRRAWWH